MIEPPTKHEQQTFSAKPFINAWNGVEKYRREHNGKLPPIQTEPQLSAEGKLNILELVDPKVPYSHFVRVLEKYTQEVIATALEEQATRHTMLMAGLEAQIEQKAVIRASELVDKARATALEEQRKQILSEVNRIVRDVAQRNNIKVGTSLFGYHYEVCSELAKLNQLKEGGGNE